MIAPPIIRCYQGKSQPVLRNQYFCTQSQLLLSAEVDNERPVVAVEPAWRRLLALYYFMRMSPDAVKVVHVRRLTRCFLETKASFMLPRRSCIGKVSQAFR